MTMKTLGISLFRSLISALVVCGALPLIMPPSADSGRQWLGVMFALTVLALFVYDNVIGPKVS